MRAKLKIDHIDQYEGGENLTFSAVCADEFGQDGEDENNTYARYTPAADLKITIQNPNLFGTFEVGQEFYVDFTPAN
mgnify:CR=1 FL=1